MEGLKDFNRIPGADSPQTIVNRFHGDSTVPNSFHREIHSLMSIVRSDLSQDHIEQPILKTENAEKYDTFFESPNTSVTSQKLLRSEGLFEDTNEVLYCKMEQNMNHSQNII